MGILFLLLILGLIFKGEYILIIMITYCVGFIIISFWDFYLIKTKIKKGVYIIIGKVKRNIFKLPFPIYFILFCAVLLFIFLIFTNFKSLNINPFPLYFIPLLINAFIINGNFKLMIKDNTIIIIDNSSEKEEWKFSKIIKVVINNNKISFYKKNDEIEISLDNEDDIIKAKQYLSERLKEKFIIEA